MDLNHHIIKYYTSIMFSIKLMCFVVLLINPVKIEGQTLSKTILLYNVCLFSLHYLFNALNINLCHFTTSYFILLHNIGYTVHNLTHYLFLGSKLSLFLSTH